MGTPVSLTDEQYRKERSKHPSVERMLRSLVFSGQEDLAVEVAAHAVENGEIGIFDLPYDRMEQEIFKTLSQRPKLSKRLTDDLIGGKSSISLMGFFPTPEDHKRLLQHIVQNKPEWVHSYISSHKAPWTHQDLLDIDDLTLKGKAGQNPVFENLLKKLPHDVTNRYFEEVLKEPLTSMWEGQPHPSGLHSFLFSLHPEVLPERAASLLIREAIKRGEDKRMILTSGRRDDGHGLVDVLDDETRELLKRRFSEGHYKTQGFENELAASRFLSALESRSPLQKAADFWHEYELDVEPHHFAVGKSLYTNQPETLTDHRGRRGSSEQYMGLLPRLRKYAQSVQQGLAERIEGGIGIGGHKASGIKSKKINGKIYVKVYRGIAGDYAKSILDKVRLTESHGAPLLAEDGSHTLKDSRIKIPAASISSWSMSPRIAEHFANRNISGHAKEGFIMSAYLPLESVIHDGFHDQFPNQPHAHRSEQELVFHHAGDNQFHTVKTKNLLVRDETGDYVPATVAPKKPKMVKSEYDPKELELGIQVEMEHTRDKKKAQEIAEEHLAETPDYYSKMKECGLVKGEDGYSWTVFHGAPKPWKGTPRISPSRGLFFTTDKNYAKDYGDVIHEATVKLNRPAVFTEEQAQGNMTIDRNELIRQGYDGRVIKYNNGHFDVIAFHPHQVELLRTHTPDGLVKVESKLVPESGPSKQLTVLHNLTQDNLLHAHELGGLPAPSLAVANINHPLSSFGEVTLVGHPDLVDPKKGAPTFDADIYSPRWPRTRHKLNGKATKKFLDWIEPYARDVGDHISGFEDTFVNQGPNVSNHGADVQKAMKLAYLRENGHQINTFYTEPRTQYTFVRSPSMKEFFDKHGFQSYIDYGSDYHREMSNAIRNAIAEDPVYAGLDPEDRKQLVDRSLKHNFTDGLYRFSAVDSVVRDFRKMGTKEIDSYAMRDAVENKVKELGEREFERWANEKLKPLSAGQFIAKWSPSRVAYTHKPYTLDNILYELTRTVRQGEDFNYGLGTARAAGAKKFRSLEAIRANAGRIVPSEEFQRHKEENAKLFDELHDLIAPYATWRDTYSNLAQAIGDSYKRNGWRALDNNGFKNVPDSVRRKFHEFAEKLVGSPTEYFESKPQRVVHLNEFHGAVVPHDAKPEVIEALKSHGIHNIETYDRSDEASRARALRNIVEHKNLYLSENTFDDLKKAIEHQFDSGYATPKTADATAHLSNVEFHANPDLIDEYEDMQNGDEDKHAKMGFLGGISDKAGYKHSESGNKYLVKPYHGGLGSVADGWGEQTITDMYKSAGIPHLIQKSHVTNGVNEHGEEMPLLVIHMEPHVVAANDMYGPNSLSDADRHRMGLDALKIQAIDYLTGNNDRHSENLMFKLDPHTGKPTNPFAIDNSSWHYSGIVIPFRSSGFRRVRMIGEDLNSHFTELGRWWQNYSPFIRNALQKNIVHLKQHDSPYVEQPQDYITSNFDKRCKELDDMFESLKRNPIGAP